MALLFILIFRFNYSLIYLDLNMNPSKEHLPPPEVAEIRTVMLEHLHDLYAFYGELTGMRMARKHISWYTKGLKDSANFRHNMNTLQTIDLQLAAIDEFFVHLESRDHRLQYDETEDSAIDSAKENSRTDTLLEAA